MTAKLLCAHVVYMMYMVEQLFRGTWAQRVFSWQLAGLGKSIEKSRCYSCAMLVLIGAFDTEGCYLLGAVESCATRVAVRIAVEMAIKIAS